MVASISPDRTWSGWQRFAVAAVGFGLATLIFATWLAYRIGGDSVTTAVDDIGEAVAAGIAAVCCAVAARHSAGQLRRAWGLIAAAAGVWCAGEIVWSLYEVGLGVAVPYPGLPDVGFVLAMPLTIAGIMSFGYTARGTSTGLRLWLDRSIVALALLGSGWSLGLSAIVQSWTSGTWLENTLNAVYPVGDILIGTVLILAIRRATHETQGRMLLLLGGVAANAVADSAFSYLNATNAYGAIGSELDTGWVAGYLMIALAALWPSAAVDRTHEEKPIDVWQLLLPWLAILFAAIVLIFGVIRHHPVDTFGTVIVSLIAALLMVSQFSAHYRSNRLVYESRVLAQTLNDVIVHAPLGVVRISRDLTVLQANPSFEAILHSSDTELCGKSLSRFFAPDALAAVNERLDSLASGTIPAAEFDSQATRPDGSTLWLHWTATAVHTRTGELDYFLVMFEDVTARRAAQDVAAANLQMLERLNRVKSQFLTRVSHEFRTALVGIQGFSELMRDSTTLDLDEVKSIADDIHKDAERLNRSLNEMLELDAEQTSRVALHLADTDVVQLVTDTVAELQVASKNHGFATHFQSTPHVAADTELLRQVLRSLLARAVSYAPSGSVIDVTTQSLNGEVQVSVADQGRSTESDIEAQLIGHGAVDRVDRVTALATGVGLPLARQIVEMHGGRLWFETGPRTVFTFSVPVAATLATATAGELNRTAGGV